VVPLNIALLKENTICFPSFLIPIVKKFSLNLEDFLLLAYFWNFKEATFDVSLIEKEIKLSESEILTSFNTLISKKVITLDTKKDGNGKIVEYINLDYLCQEILTNYQQEEKQKEEKDIFTIFEAEFGRPFSSMEYEIIKNWLDKGIKEELVLGALKEAVYNNAMSLRYIDTILNSWSKKGYKTMKEVRNHNFGRKEKETPQELFDYNWLDDNEG